MIIINQKGTSSTGEGTISLLTAKSSALRLFNNISYAMQRDAFIITRDQDERHLTEFIKHVFHYKKITKPKARTIVGDGKLATGTVNALRGAHVLSVEGVKKGATRVFTDKWVHHDHEVVGA